MMQTHAYRPAPEISHLNARIITELDDRPQLPDVIAWWLSATPATIAGKLWSRLTTSQVLPGDRSHDRIKVIGEPGDVWCSFYADPHEARPEHYVDRLSGVYTPQAFDTFLGQVGVPTRMAEVRMLVVPSRGEQNGTWIKVGVHAVEEHGTRWLMFTCHASNDLTLGSHNNARLAEHVHRLADTINPGYGEIHNTSGFWDTALENKLGLGSDPEGEHSPRKILRGYGWITVAAQEIGDRLGGIAALTSSGAFSAVEQLANGGYWLQATLDFDSYTQEAGSRVWNALAGAIPAGQPLEDSPWDAPSRIVPADARQAAG